MKILRQYADILTAITHYTRVIAENMPSCLIVKDCYRTILHVLNKYDYYTKLIFE